MQKKYLTTVLNCPKEQKGELVNYLKKNALTNNVYVATVGTTGAKRAELKYKVLENYIPYDQSGNQQKLVPKTGTDIKGGDTNE